MRLVILSISLLLAGCNKHPEVVNGEYVGPSAALLKAARTDPDSLQAAQLQLLTVPFHRNVRHLAGFSELHIEHEPRWHVVVAFTRLPPRRQVIALAPAAIRDRILIRSARRTQAQIASELDAIAAAVNRTGVAFTGGYNPRTQRFDLVVGAPAQVERVRAALPVSVRRDTDIRVGALPVPEMGSPR